MRFPPCLVFLTIALLVAACNKPKAKPTADEPIVPVAKLTAEELIDEYKKNQLGADQKYKDKPIQVTGKVARVEKVALAGYYVGIGSAHEGEFDIMCFLDKDDKSAEEKAGKLKEGDAVTMVGRCEGKAGGLGSIYLRYSFFPK
jgi:hypothetical protein